MPPRFTRPYDTGIAPFFPRPPPLRSSVLRLVSPPTHTKATPLRPPSSPRLLTRPQTPTTHPPQTQQDGVIASPIDGDIGAVFGIGFPPFLGGPFRLLDALGPAKYCDMLRGFADKYGPQFAPAPLLEDHAKSGKKFHPK